MLKWKCVMVVLVVTMTSCIGSSDQKVKFENIDQLQIPIAKKLDSSTISDIVKILDTIWRTEQEPIVIRDSLIRIYGAESKEYTIANNVAEKNHAVNEVKVKQLIDEYGWLSEEIIGEQGSRTLCNVIQHSDNEVRIAYLPMMKTAVLEKKLQPWFLMRAQDRIATEANELQVYGGQIKYYPETKTFNVWPILDPENVDKRRAEIGLEPMKEFLKTRRFPVKWNLEEQIKRTEAFKNGKHLP